MTYRSFARLLGLALLTFAITAGVVRAESHGDNRDDEKSGKSDRVGDGNSGLGDDIHKKDKAKSEHGSSGKKDHADKGKKDKAGKEGEVETETADDADDGAEKKDGAVDEEPAKDKGKGKGQDKEQEKDKGKGAGGSKGDSHGKGKKK
jgi:hypothetical protein